MSKAGPSEWARDTDEEDLVELAIRRSGCWDQHIACVECMVEKSDWRMCQEPLNAFRKCMEKNTLKQKEENDLMEALGATSNSSK